jgi:IS5 family transposase
MPSNDTTATTPEHVGSTAELGKNDLMTEAVRNLRVKWVVRQQVRTVEKAWLVDLYESDIERVARIAYDRWVRENPEAYFELVAVAHFEVCRAFTPFKG